MKTAIGLLIAVTGGILVYDGFAGRSLWSDFLSIIRGQGLPANNGNKINPQGGVGSAQYGPTYINPQGGVGTNPYGPIYSTTQGPTAPVSEPINPQGGVGTVPYGPNPIGPILGLG
jgi:hypothetical protein